MKIALTQVHVQPSPNGMLVQVQGVDAEGNAVIYTHTMPTPKLPPGGSPSPGRSRQARRPDPHERRPVMSKLTALMTARQLRTDPEARPRVEIG